MPDGELLGHSMPMCCGFFELIEDMVTNEESLEEAIKYAKAVSMAIVSIEVDKKNKIIKDLISNGFRKVTEDRDGRETKRDIYILELNSEGE